MQVHLTVNGVEQTHETPDNRLLVELLRERLGLTGVHVGCDTSQCGACTVLVDGHSVKSCTILAAQVDGARIVTIEGLAPDDGLHPMQEAFRQHHGLQCGFCTPGMILAGVDIAQRLGVPDRQQIAHELDGNLCRCTGYQNILTAIEAGARAMAAA